MVRVVGVECTAPPSGTVSRAKLFDRIVQLWLENTRTQTRSERVFQSHSSTNHAVNHTLASQCTLAHTVKRRIRPARHNSNNKSQNHFFSPARLSTSTHLHTPPHCSSTHALPVRARWECVITGTSRFHAPTHAHHPPAPSFCTFFSVLLLSPLISKKKKDVDVDDEQCVRLLLFVVAPRRHPAHAHRLLHPVHAPRPATPHTAPLQSAFGSCKRGEERNMHPVCCPLGPTHRTAHTRPAHFPLPPVNTPKQNQKTTTNKSKTRRERDDDANSKRRGTPDSVPSSAQGSLLPQRRCHSDSTRPLHPTRRDRKRQAKLLLSKTVVVSRRTTTSTFLSFASRLKQNRCATNATPPNPSLARIPTKK